MIKGYLGIFSEWQFYTVVGWDKIGVDIYLFGEKCGAL
jgi:hypothetical protein